MSKRFRNRNKNKKKIPKALRKKFKIKKNVKFEEEKEWAIFQLRLGMKRKDADRLQKKDAQKFIKLLNNKNKSIEYKREKMRQSFGNIRNQMKLHPLPSKSKQEDSSLDEILEKINSENEKKEFEKKITENKVKIPNKPKKSILEKNNEDGNFLFNFSSPSSSDLKIQDDKIFDDIPSEDSPSSGTERMVNVFPFNFDEDKKKRENVKKKVINEDENNLNKVKDNKEVSIEENLGKSEIKENKIEKRVIIKENKQKNENESLEEIKKEREDEKNEKIELTKEILQQKEKKNEVNNQESERQVNSKKKKIEKEKKQSKERIQEKENKINPKLECLIKQENMNKREKEQNESAESKERIQEIEKEKELERKKLLMEIEVLQKTIFSKSKELGEVIEKLKNLK